MPDGCLTCTSTYTYIDKFTMRPCQVILAKARIMWAIELYSSGQPAVSFRSPLAFPPTTRNTKPKREATFHPPQFTTLHSVTTLAFPNPISGMSCEGILGKVKVSHGLCACSRFVSLIQLFHSYLTALFHSFTSPASAPHL